ncbi:MAG: hypothetical protein A2383_02205 [Candidatus Pacebacteria bacterium RIFOXYB1_FULL_39_46]|nr:MAG: hypothetical protein A2383_02205 [Candidatus Pacebacteria bacterium RIFOXYB1_FULL_39_46]OGJ39122.1 MAG: hypothetical protein A2182_02245 [Candidatus Pacebacteria bacterium RIFOXYA1_FULL_38_18]OGJ40178.1 MAG: hypothetical protein A2582_03760 [Candidatus Pacebacteria bacterium RIFOXYD1_FULL_39_27]OGJ41061.1 MAG: hypothetical protein A2411_01105 [Candidatus Pacebacteria bacterium RIFOXYC1_FULL_39_21]
MKTVNNQKRNLEDKIMALLKLEHLLSAKEILEKLQGLDQNYNKTSVYRALERLLAKGILCQHHLGEAGLTYELRSDNHEHLQCEVCGKIKAIPHTFSQPASIEGFKISHHHLTYLGICPDCQ